MRGEGEKEGRKRGRERKRKQENSLYVILARHLPVTQAGTASCAGLLKQVIVF